MSPQTPSHAPQGGWPFLFWGQPHPSRIPLEYHGPQGEGTWGPSRPALPLFSGALEDEQQFVARCV